MANGGHSEEEDSPDDEAAQAAARAAATLEYDEFAAEINALSMAEALRVCELEGIAPRDSSLLGVRAALLLHFCGPPPKLEPGSSQKDRRALRRKAPSLNREQRGEKRLDRLARGQSDGAVVPIWCWRRMAELVGDAEVERSHVQERLAAMPWHEAKVASIRLGIQTDKATLSEVREGLERCLLAPADSPHAAAARLTPRDYKLILKHMTYEQSVAATKNLGIVPLEWTEKMCKAALLSHLSPPPILEQFADKRGKRGVTAIVKAMAAGATAMSTAGISPFEKWRSSRKNKLQTLESGVARLLFDEIDTDGSGELTASELRAIAERLGGGITNDEIDDAMMEMDHGGDGSIGAAEFEAWWSSARASDSTWTRLINKRERLEQERSWLHELFTLIDAGNAAPRLLIATAHD